MWMLVLQFFFFFFHNLLTFYHQNLLWETLEEDKAVAYTENATITNDTIYYCSIIHMSWGQNPRQSVDGRLFIKEAAMKGWSLC